MSVLGEDILEEDVDIDAPYAPAPAPAPEEIVQVQEGPVAEVAPPAAAPPADVPDAVWDVLFPRRSVYRDAIVKHALPRLLVILKDPANRLLPNRDLVGKALDQCKEDRQSSGVNSRCTLEEEVYVMPFSCTILTLCKTMLQGEELFDKQFERSCENCSSLPLEMRKINSL